LAVSAGEEAAMPDMSVQEIWDFLCAVTRTAHVGTTRPDRRPHVRAAATRIGARYMEAGRAAEFGARNGVPGELLIRVTPVRVIAQRAVSG
jgi:hypothetical protein